MILKDSYFSFQLNLNLIIRIGIFLFLISNENLISFSSVITYTQKCTKNILSAIIKSINLNT